jgi:hypothetical protein
MTSTKTLDLQVTDSAVQWADIVSSLAADTTGFLHEAGLTGAREADMVACFGDCLVECTCYEGTGC